MSLTAKGGGCTCKYEIDNNLPRTKFCFVACAAQRQQLDNEIAKESENMDEIARQKVEFLNIEIEEEKDKPKEEEK